MATILSAHTPALFEAAVARATELLRAGEVVALPTETVYGLAANALNPAAVRRIYEIKGRPAHNPIIVHVTGREMARACVTEWSAEADRLATSFWPGPLTLVLPRAATIPDDVTAGGNTVGVRAPSHPLFQAVIRACGFPLAAPSANPANQLSPTNAEHVQQSLGDRVSLIVDGGQSQVGIESTVLDISVKPPRLLRPGMIHEQSLLAVTGVLQSGSGDTGPLRSPGLLKKHYSPRAHLLVLDWRNEQELRQKLVQHGDRDFGRTFIIAHSHVPSLSDYAGVSVIPHDAEAFARALYSELHRCDAENAGLIVVEAVPASGEWRGVADRLARAAAQG